MAAARTVVFDAPWGEKSWKVKYSGPYENDRQPHVEVGAANMTKHKKGDSYTLTNLHARGRAYMFDVPGCKNGTHVAHFTVAFGSSKPLESFR